MNMTRAKRIAILTALTLIPVAALAAAAVSPESSGHLYDAFIGMFSCSGGCPNG